MHRSVGKEDEAKGTTGTGDQTHPAHGSPEHAKNFVEFWGLPPLILFFNVSIGWVLRFVLSTVVNQNKEGGYGNLNWPRCSAWVTESLALTDGGFC